MTDYEKIQQQINHNKENSDERVQEITERFQNTLTNDSFNSFCNEIKWYTNQTLQANVTNQLWENASELINNEEHSEEENIEEIKKLVKWMNSKLRMCSLSNMRVDGHGIQELEEHKAIAKFLSDLENIVHYYLED